jgi:formylmethanofuran dehydrogenase subunit C
VRNSEVTGDSTGEYVRTCTPVVDDEIECNGAFQLSGGTIEIEATAHDDPGETTSTAAISGGTGAYAGAFGAVEVNFEENTYRLHVLIPNL